MSCLSILTTSLFIQAPPADAVEQSKPHSEKRESIKMALTKDEQELAKKLGFDETTMLLIKETLAPQFGLVKMGPDYSGNGMAFVIHRDFSRVLLPQDRTNYENIARKYPELKPLIDRELSLYKTQAENLAEEQSIRENQLKNSMGADRYARYKRYLEAVSQYLPVMEQEAAAQSEEEKSEQSLPSGVKRIQNVDESFLDSDKTLEHKIEELHSKYKGKVLNPDSGQFLALGLRFKGPGNIIMSNDRRLEKLRERLEPLGYRFETKEGIRHTKVFESKDEALKYLAEWQTTPEFLSLQETPACSFDAAYPETETLSAESAKSSENSNQAADLISRTNTPEAPPADLIHQLMQAGDPKLNQNMLQLMKPELRILPGTRVEKKAPGHWHFEQPARYEAKAVERTATVIKVDPSDPGFEMLSKAGTFGVNSGLDTKDIINHLKKWHDKYGVTVLSANHDSLKIRFTRLPDDLSEICTEHFLMGCETELHEDFIQNAAMMRDHAASIRKTKELSFWWD